MGNASNCEAMFHNGELVRYSLISITSSFAKVGHVTREVDDKKMLEDTVADCHNGLRVWKGGQE